MFIVKIITAVQRSGNSNAPMRVMRHLHNGKIRAVCLIIIDELLFYNTKPRETLKNLFSNRVELSPARYFFTTKKECER